MNQKYEFTGATNPQGLRQIRRLRDLEIGGWIQSESNLSEEGDCWVADSAKVYGCAVVYGDAQISDHAQVFGWADVCGDARVHGYAIVKDIACVYGHANVGGCTSIGGSTKVS
jgi:acyl-[acyl carrier protein]--UDP-N-acetylglucosamine O-acyltransferase